MPFGVLEQKVVQNGPLWPDGGALPQPIIIPENNPIKNTDPDGREVRLGQGEYGGDLYTGADAQNLFKSLQQIQDQGDEDKKQKKQKKDNVGLTGDEQIAIGLRNYGGDYSGSAWDHFQYVLDQLNQLNPIANLWDGITGSIYGTDRFGNEQSTSETGWKYAMAIPIGKAYATVAERIEFSLLREGMATTLGNANNISHIMQAKHGLSALLKVAGSETNVIKRLYLSLGQEAILPASGTFERVVTIYGNQVTIRGAVVNGVPRISTAFIP